MAALATVSAPSIPTSSGLFTIPIRHTKHQQHPIAPEVPQQLIWINGKTLKQPSHILIRGGEDRMAEIYHFVRAVKLL